MPSLTRAFSAISNLRRREPAPRKVQTLIDQAIMDLASLNQATEGHFLTMGEKLGGFLRATRKLSADLSALSELIAGEFGSHTAEVLEHVLEGSRRAEAQAIAGGGALTRLGDFTGRIGQTFRSFRETVSIFRVAGSLTRVETARLGDAGAEFGNLTEEIDVLTASIELSGQCILDASVMLQQEMRPAMLKIAGLRDRELRQLPGLVSEVAKSLESLDARRRRAAEMSLHQASEYKEVSAAIEDMITAIQFHDITRQQVEHVVTALEGLRADGYIDSRALLQLQSSQLSNTAKTFESSVSRIQGNLASITRRVREMTQAGAALLGGSSDEQDSFFRQMEDRFERILKVLSSCAQAESDTSSTTANLENATQHMWNSVRSIREIEVRISRIAINATIRAVQLGDAGNPLSVLAGVMQRLAVDSTKINDGMAQALDAATGAADRLSRNSPAGPNIVLVEMRDAIRDLHTASESSFRGLKELSALGAGLSEDIAATQTGFTVGTLFAESASHVLGQLEHAMMECGGDSPRRIAGDTGTGLHDLTKHYTMQAEWEVHHGLAPAAESATGATLTPAPSDSEIGEFGDNVELF